MRVENSEYLSGLVLELCKLPKETEWVEFKLQNVDPDEIGELISWAADALVCPVNDEIASPRRSRCSQRRISLCLSNEQN